LSIRTGEIDRLVAIVPPNPVVLIVLVSEYFEHVTVAAPRVEFGGLDDDFENAAHIGMANSDRLLDYLLSQEFAPSNVC